MKTHRQLIQNVMPIGLLVISFRFYAQTEAATLTVNSAADNNGPGTLRSVVGLAQPGDTIDFDAALNGTTINLNLGDIAIQKSLNIVGPGATKLTIVGVNQRIFHVNPQNNGISFAISGLHLRGNIAAANGANGNDGVAQWPGWRHGDRRLHTQRPT